MKNVEGQTWIVLGIGICLYAYRMDLGTFQDPGVGFVAFVTGIFLAAVGILLIAFSGEPIKKSPGEIGCENPASGSLILTRTFKVSYTVALLVIYAFVLNHLGYVLTTFAIMFGLFFDLSKRRFAVPLWAAFLTTGITYLVFEVWLKSQLPRGIFPWW